MAVPEEEKVLTEATSATPNFDINYEDERLTQWETKGESAKAENGALYDGMIANSDKYYNDQIQLTKDWEAKQTQIQQDNTDFAIEKIEQQKAQANKDYIKEQSGAYTDWRKQSNQYGAEAEKMASAGLTNTGYSESSQVSMYNTYQNRVATAREVYSQAVLNYNNAIKDAQLQNNAALAEIAYQSLQKQLELSLQGFQYKNQLILEKSDKQLEIDNMYYQRWQDTLQQMNTENAMKADIWKHQDTQRFQAEQAEIDRQFQEKINTINNEFKAKEAELDRKHQINLENLRSENAIKEENARHANEMKELEKQKQNAIDVANHEYSLQQAAIKKQSNTSSGSGSIKSGSLSKEQGNAIVDYIDKNGGTTTQGFTGKTYSEAVKYMTSNGVPNSYASGIMTLSEWSRRKNANSSSAHVKGYSSYGAYLKDIVNYNVETYGK